MNKEFFVQNVKMLCLQKGVKPTNACKESGVGGSFLSDINRGQTPSVEKVQLLAQYLGVTTSELLGEEKPTPVSGDGLIGPAKQALLDMMDDMDDEELLALAELIKATKKMRDTK